MPNRGSQSGGLLPSFEGSQLRLVTGDYVRVIEDYPVAHERLWPTTIRQGNITGLQEALADKSESAKKVPPAKKRTETTNITVEKDEPVAQSTSEEKDED
jgi:hypothetical protein